MHLPAILWTWLMLVVTPFIFEVTCQEFTVTPSDTVVRRGQPARFNCSADPAVVRDQHMNWFHDNKRVFSTYYNQPIPVGYSVDKDENAGRYDLIVESTDKKHASSYMCELSKTQKREHAMLAVVEQVTCSQQPENMEVMDNEPITLTCSVRSSGSLRPNIVWETFDIPKMNSASTTNNDLYSTVINVRGSELDDSIRAQCKVTFQLSNGQKAAYFDECEKRINIQHPVSAVTVDGHGVGGSVLSCSARGKPAPRFYWINIDTYYKVEGQTLVVQNDWIGTEQNWECVALNTINGKNFESKTSKTFTVTAKQDGAAETSSSSAENGLMPLSFLKTIVFHSVIAASTVYTIF